MTTSGKDRKGLIIVYTGEGKGKTSAALGGVIRAFGHGFRIKVFQFIKRAARSGEQKTLEKLGIETESLGKGFTWKSKSVEDDIKLAQEGWKKVTDAILSDSFDLIILDELNYVMDYGFLKCDEVIEVFRKKPEHLHLIITGRGAPEELIEMADLVTEMRMIKHPFHSKGIKAQEGVEY